MISREPPVVIEMSRNRLKSHRPLFLAKSKESKDIPVGIVDFEAPQAVVYERQLFHERHTPLAKLVEERVGVQRVDVRIPTSPPVSSVVWTRKHVGKDGLEKDTDPVSAHLAIVHISVRTLEVELKPEALDVVG